VNFLKPLVLQPRCQKSMNNCVRAVKKG